MEFAIPSIASIVLTCLYNLVDAIFLGHAVGEIGLAATQAAVPLSMTITTIVSLPGLGAIALASICLGSGKRAQAELIMGNTATLTVLFSAICTVLGLVFLEPILSLSGATADIMPAAKSFMGIICLGSIFQGLFLNLNNFIRTAGNPKRALLYNGSGMIACIVLNFLFVILFGWGVIGSACATVAGQTFSLLLIIAYFWKKNAVMRFHKKNFAFRRNICAQICILGIPLSVSQMVFTLISCIMNILFIQYGASSPYGPTGALASISVVSRVTQIAMYAIYGVSIGAQPIMGYNFGALKFDRLKRTFWISILWTTAICSTFLIPVIISPQTIVGLFGINPLLATLTGRLLAIYVAALPLIGVQVMAATYFQATDRAGRSTVLYLLQQGLLMLPLLFIFPRFLPLVFPAIDPLESIMWSAPASNILATIVMTRMMAGELKRLDHRHLNRAEPSGD